MAVMHYYQAGVALHDACVLPALVVAFFCLAVRKIADCKY
jgi:hypothetical protein